jgi:WD40 repeat protein
MSRSIAILLVLSAPILAAPKLDQHGDPLPEGTIVRFGTVRNRIGSSSMLWSWAVSPDGKVLATEDRLNITLWDLETGMPVKRLPSGGSKGIHVKFDLCFAPNGRDLARLAGRLVSVIDTASGKQAFMHDLIEEVKAGSIAYDIERKQIVVASDELSKVIFLDAESGRVVLTLDTEVPPLHLSRTGRYFLGKSSDVPCLIDAKTGRVLRRFPDAAGATSSSLVLAPDDKQLHVIYNDGRLQTFDTRSGKKVQECAPPPIMKYGENPPIVTLSHDGSTAFFAARGQPTLRRELKTGKWLHPLPTSLSGPILALPDGRHVIQIGCGGVLRRYDLVTLKHVPEPFGFEDCLFATPSPDGRRIVAAFEDPAGKRLAVFDASAQLQWSILMDEWPSRRWSTDKRHRK